MSDHIRTARAFALTGAAIIAIAAASEAQAQGAIRFHIAPQPLTPALQEFGRQSGMTVVADEVLTRGKVSVGYAAVSDPDTALRTLLRGTGLTVRRRGKIFLVGDDKTAELEPPQQAEAVPGDIVVTARKREESIQDVPVAITAVTQADLTTRQVTGGPDLITQVPNMSFTKTNFTGYSIQIRGIGTQAISATTDPAVSVAFNNTPFIRNRFFEQEFYDLERIEILRGPQGTLYGRNATAGVVNLISAKPGWAPAAKASQSHQFSQEFRVTSSNDGPFNFNAGINFLRYRTEDEYYVMFNSLSLIAAQSSYALLPGQDLGGGDRSLYSGHEHKPGVHAERTSFARC